MTEATLLHELIDVAAGRAPDRPALTWGTDTISYATLAARVDAFARGVRGLGLPRGGRVGIYLEKRIEWVVACFGAAAAGGVFVPLNPLLKPEQVGYILRDCDVSVLVTSPERLAQIISDGALAQVTASSLAGAFGGTARRFSVNALRSR